MSAEAIALKAAGTVAGKIGGPAASAFWAWWRGGELGHLARILEREFGPRVHDIKYQPDAIGLIWLLRDTGTVDEELLAISVRPLWWQLGQDEAQAVAMRVAHAIRTEYPRLVKGDKLVRFQGRQLASTLERLDVERRAGARAAAESRLHELTAFPDLPPVGAILDDDGSLLVALGVSPSSIADRYRPPAARPPYVNRDTDRALVEALAESRFVTLRGPSKAGKSRTALEVAASQLPAHHLIAPRARAVVHELVRDEILDLRCLQDEPALLWLDNIDRYLAEDPYLDALFLRGLLERRSGLIVLATLQQGSYARPSVRASVAHSRMVALEGRLSPEELSAAKRAYPHEHLDVATRLGEHFVAADELVARLESADDEGMGGLGALGRAVVESAIDLRRVGVSQAIPRAVLWRLFAGIDCDSYVRLRGRTAGRLTETAFDAALDAATQPVASSVALLMPGAGAGDVEAYEPFEFIVAHARGETHFPTTPRAVEFAAYVVALEDLVSGAEDLSVVAGVVPQARDADSATQRRLVKAFEQGAARGGVSADATFIALKDLARSEADVLVAGLVDVAVQTLSVSTPKASILVPTIGALLDAGDTVLADRLIEALGTGPAMTSLTTEALARLATTTVRAVPVAVALLDALAARLRDESGGVSLGAPEAAELLIALLDAPRHTHSSELVIRLRDAVVSGPLDKPLRARLLVELLRSDHAKDADPLVADVIADVDLRHVDGRLAADVAHALDLSGRTPEADRVFDVLAGRARAGSLGLAATAALVGRMAQRRRSALTEEVAQILSARLETQHLPKELVDRVTGLLKRNGRPDLADDVRAAAKRGAGPGGAVDQ